MRKNLQLFVPVLVLAGIISSKVFGEMANSPFKLNWFDELVPAGNYEHLWGYEQPLFLYNTWSDVSRCRTKMLNDGKSSQQASVGADECKRTAEELEEIVKDVEEGAYFKYSLDYIHTILSDAAELWTQSVKFYFKNGLVSIKVDDPDDPTHKKKIAKDINMIFGPWVLWSKRKFLSIEWQWSKNRRKQAYDEAVDMDNLQNDGNHNNPSVSTSHDHLKRQRQKQRLLQQQQITRDRSRTRISATQHSGRRVGFKSPLVPPHSISLTQSEQVQFQCAIGYHPWVIYTLSLAITLAILRLPFGNFLLQSLQVTVDLFYRVYF